MGKGKSSVSMQKRKPLATNAALLTALLLSAPAVALADKGGKGPGNPWNPSANLGLGAIPKVGVGLPAMGPTTIPPGTVFAVPAMVTVSAAPRSGGGVPAQIAAPGAGRSASSAGLMPPGHSKPHGAEGPRGHGSENGSGNAYGPDRSRSGEGTVPPGLARSAGSDVVQGPGQAANEEQESGALPGTPSLSQMSAPERLASAQSPSSETTENRSGPLPTCR